MSRKFSAARKQAFLTALTETGNQTIAAERAKVSRSWVQLHRSTDPEFDGQVRSAIEVAKSALRAPPHPNPSGRQSCPPDKTKGRPDPAEGRGANQPPRGWGFLDGEELVVKGTNGRRVQIARARLKQWTPRVEDRFLAVVAATCNVRAACAEVGMTPASAYAHRGRWPAFARRWDEAIAAGTIAIEAALLEAGANLFSSEGATETGAAGDTPAITGMDAHGALHLLYMHKHYLPRPGRLPGRPRTRASEAETIAAIERGLAALARQRKRKRERAAKEKEAGEGEAKVGRHELNS